MFKQPKLTFINTDLLIVKQNTNRFIFLQDSFVKLDKIRSNPESPLFLHPYKLNKSIESPTPFLHTSHKIMQ